MNSPISCALLCLLGAISAEAGAQTCAQLSKTLSAGWQRDVPCYCKPEELAHVQLKLPKGVSLKAVCALRGIGGTFVDLRRQPVDMNQYDASGNSFDGEFYLSGALTLSGLIRVQSGNAGDLWFTPSTNLGNPNTPFGSQLRTFKIALENDYKKFRVSQALLSRPCSFANARVQFKGFRVSLGETDDTGAYPLEVRVVRVSQYRSCRQQ